MIVALRSSRPVLLRVALLLLSVLCLLFLTGSSCPNSNEDYIRIQQAAVWKIDNRNPQKRPNSTIVKIPPGTSFTGFKGQTAAPGEEGGDPSQVVGDPLIIGYFLVDLNFDDQPDQSYQVLANTPGEAFIDESKDRIHQPDSEVHLLYDGFDQSISISDPKGGVLAPAGSYSFVLFRRLLTVTDPTRMTFTVRSTLYFDDLQPPDNEVQLTRIWQQGAQVLPHVPFGTAAPYEITSEIVLNNPNAVDSTVRLQFYETATGLALPVTLRGVSASEHTVVVPANSSRLVEVEPPADEVKLSWALVQGNPAVEASVNYVTYPAGHSPAIDQTGVLGEAGISAAPTHYHHVLNVTRASGGISTAFAVVNPTEEDARVTVSLTRSGGANVAGDEVIGTRVLEIPALQQSAAFFHELFSLQEEEFAGTLVFDSDADIAITSLKTVNGLQSASLPSGSFTLGRSR